MPHYLPDTNAFSDYAHGKHAALSVRMDNGAHNQSLILSAIVLAEMSYDWQKTGGTKRTTKQRAFVTQLTPQPFDGAAARAYGLLKYYLRHATIGERDLFIAAHAIALDAVLVTRNTREFSKVPGLAVEDWSS